jgi:hypothetical protein
MPPRHHQHLDDATMMQKAYWEKECACVKIENTEFCLTYAPPARY